MAQKGIYLHRLNSNVLSMVRLIVFSFDKYIYSQKGRVLIIYFFVALRLANVIPKVTTKALVSIDYICLFLSEFSL